MAANTPWRCKCRASRVTSPNQQGSEGTDSAEAWMLTGKYVILVIEPPYRKKLCFLPSVKEAHFYACSLLVSSSLRTSWAFGELDFPFPLAALLDLKVQSGIGHDLIDALKAGHIPQFGAQHRDGIASKLGRAFEACSPRITVEHLIKFVLDLCEIGQGMLQLVTQDLQAQRSRVGSQATGAGLGGQSHQLLGRLAPITPGCYLAQGSSDGLHPTFDEAGGTGIALEESQGGRTARIGEDLNKLGKQHDQQGLDLVLVARAVIGKLTVQALQLAIRRDQLVGHRARPRLAAQQDARNRGGIQAVGLGPQAPLLCKLMRLAWMQQAQP